MVYQENLYELTPKEFERLCGDILKYLNFQRVEIVGGLGDQGIDIIGETDGRNVVVQVKHTKKIHKEAIHKIIAQVKTSFYQPKELLIMTSATISQSQKQIIEQLSGPMVIDVMDQAKILKILNENSNIQSLYFSAAKRRTIRQRWELFLGSSFAVSAIVGIIMSGISFFVHPDKPQLQERIETVEVAIGHLKSLEKQLSNIKKDMVQTERATKTIKQEYALAKELEKLTEEQHKAIKHSLQNNSWQRTLVDAGLGLILGVAGSLFATVIYSRYQQHRALNKEI
jgi:Restriction endonuclease